MKYRFYIVDTIIDFVRYTNSEETANSFAQKEQYIVIDTEKLVTLVENVAYPISELD